MKRIIFISLLLLISGVAMSQKVTVQVIKAQNAVRSEWQILDEKYKIVFPGNEYFRSDTVTFTLDANKRYILQISVSETYDLNTTLYTLVLNEEPIILIKSEIRTGRSFFPVLHRYTE